MGGGMGSVEAEDTLKRQRKRVAISFVIIIGLVALLADMSNEGIKSITGPYLGMLGASAATVGIIAGLGELVGFSLRVVFGWLTDRTGRYWTLVLIGYGINLLVVPLFALAGDWVMAATFIIMERIGRAMRGPPRDAMISHATVDVGRGWAYGVQEALSSVGGMLGPMVVVIVLYLGGDYRMGIWVLVIPAMITMVLLARAFAINRRPRELEGSCDAIDTKRRLPKVFWIYAMAGAFIAAGYADFPLIAFHIDKFAIVSEDSIPILYAVANAADALAALTLGKLYDRRGMMPLIIVSLFIPLFAPLTFSNGFYLMLVGMVIYGIGFGAQESVMRAIVADMAPFCRRASAFGYYNGIFGISWFLGSLLLGMLYDVSLWAMISLSMGLQFMAIPIMVHVHRNYEHKVRGSDGNPWSEE